MKPLCLFALIPWILTLAAGAAETRNPFDVPDPLEETWWTAPQEAAFFTNGISIDAKLAKAIADNLPAAKDPKDTNLVHRRQQTRQHLASQPPYVWFSDLFALLQPTNDAALQNLIVQLSDHTNVAIEFFALVYLAGHGDRAAAETILKIPARKNLSSNDIVILKNLLHSPGIDPVHDTPAMVIQRTRKMVSGRDDESEPERLPAGTAAPDFEIKTLAGKVVRLSDYRGKTVLLHFWSTSCGPCIGEFPEMTRALRAQLQRRKDLVVLAVALDDNRKTIQEAIKKYDLGDWTHLCDGRGWASVPALLYRITSIPSDVIIDPKGIISADSWRHLEGLRTVRAPQ
jgi:peroxiredoxin